MQVFLTPTPQLTIHSLTVPLTAASITQPIGINWNIFNNGFNDNIEKNKGHYYVAGSTYRNTCELGLQSYRDSLGFGSSYWINKVYLSTDGRGLNTSSALLLSDVAQGMQYSGYYSSDYVKPGICEAGGSTLSGENTSNVITPGSNYPAGYTFTVPEYLPEGDYYIYVHTNATKTVYEYPGTPQIERSASPITIRRPDLTVLSVTVPSNITGGQPFSIKYEVRNNGQGSVFNVERKDRIYVSTSPVFDASAQLITTQRPVESVAAGSSVEHSFNYTLPQATSGTRYFYVYTNFDSAFRETNYTNNISAAAATFVSATSPNDLVVSAVQLADTVFTLYNNYIKYTVVNNGTGTTAGNWTDSVFISCGSVLQAVEIVGCKAIIHIQM